MKKSEKQRFRKNLQMACIGSVVCLAVALFLFVKKEEAIALLRPEPGTLPRVEEFIIKKAEEEQVVSVEIAPREYSEDRINSMHAQAVEYIESQLPGKNATLCEVRENLSFPEVFPESKGAITWSTDAPWLVNSEGLVFNEGLTEVTSVLLCARIAYGSEFRTYERVITVYPKIYTEKEKEQQQVREELQRLEQEGKTEETLLLPQNIYGWSIRKKEGNAFGMELFLVLLAAVLPLFAYATYRSELEEREKCRREQAQEAYAGFVTKFSLLLAAGVPVRQIFYRLEAEYAAKYGADHSLALELKRTKQELEHGYSETNVYELFGRRMKLLQYQRMAGLLGQNVTKGLQSMRQLLLQEAREVMAEERANIKTKGEQAGSKLLLPMMGLLLLVFGILLVPAFQTF